MENNKTVNTDNEFPNVGLSSPWVTFYREVDELFKNDPEVRVQYSDAIKNPKIKIFVDSLDKYEALTALLPAEKTFGDVTIYISVIPPNLDEESFAELLRRALKGNPILDRLETVELFGKPLTYAIFDREVVQYFNDNLASYNGVTSNLYENIMKDVFGNIDGVSYCTDNYLVSSKY